MPFVSFCFTTYKRPDILIDTVKSILPQTFSDFEIIISDNDPEESGRKITEVLIDSRIKYFPNKENLGMKKSFNKSLERSTGEYIVMIADDDPVYPGMLETLVDLNKKYPGYGMYLGGGDWYCTHPTVAGLYNMKIGTNTMLNNDHEIDHVWLLNPEQFITGLFRFNLLTNYLWSSGMVKREVLIEMGGVPDYGTPFLGDYAYLSIMAAHSGVVLINRALGRQTIHLENFGRSQNDQLKQAVLGFREYAAELFRKKNTPDSVYDAMDRFLGMWVGIHLAFLFAYYKKQNLPLDSLKAAEKEVFEISIVKKFYWKYHIKKNFPEWHDRLVRIKQNLTL